MELIEEGGSWGPNGVGWIWQSGPGQLKSAIPEAASNLLHLETEWDQEKLETKINQYFKKGAKGMDFTRKSLKTAIIEYADNTMSTLFAALYEREWFTTGQADLLGVMIAAVKDIFPPRMLKHIGQEEFDQTVLAAYERAFDNQRFEPLLQEAVPAVVSGPKIKRKVSNGVLDGRKFAQDSGIEVAEDFVAAWINHAVKNITVASFGNAEDTIPQESCAELFRTLLEGGGMPLQFQQEGAEPPVAQVDALVEAAYTDHAGATEESEAAAAAPASKKPRLGAWGGGQAAAAAEPGAVFKKNPYGKGAWIPTAAAGGKGKGKGW